MTNPLRKAAVRVHGRTAAPVGNQGKQGPVRLLHAKTNTSTKTCFLKAFGTGLLRENIHFVKRTIKAKRAKHNNAFRKISKQYIVFQNE